MRKTYDLLVVTGTYEKNGETKRRYQNVGVVLEGDKGPMILLDKHFNPAGVEGKDGRIVISMFEPKDEQGSGYTKPSRQGAGGGMSNLDDGTNGMNELDDEIPF